MADAISTLSAGDGFLKGFSATDNYIRNNNNDKRIAERDAISEARYAAEAQRRDQQDALSSQRYDQGIERQDARYAVIDQRQAERDAMAKAANAEQLKNNSYVRERQERMEAEQKLIAEAPLYWDRALNGQGFDAEFEAKVRAIGKESLAPSSVLDPDVVAMYQQGGILKRELEKGNLGAANTPEGIELANKIFGNKFKTGIGESTGPAGTYGIGKIIKDKELARWDVAPGGKGVVPILKVIYSDGTSAEKPMTAGQSSDPNDPVMVIDPGQLIAGLEGKEQMAKLAMDPKVRENLIKSWQRGTGNVHPDAAAASAKALRDEQNAVRLTGDALKAQQGSFSEEGPSIGRAYQDAREAISGVSQAQEQQPQQAPQNAINMLKTNPSLAPQFKQKYGYLPEGF